MCLQCPHLDLNLDLIGLSSPFVFFLLLIPFSHLHGTKKTPKKTKEIVAICGAVLLYGLFVFFLKQKNRLFLTGMPKTKAEENTFSTAATISAVVNATTIQRTIWMQDHHSLDWRKRIVVLTFTEDDRVSSEICAVKLVISFADDCDWSYPEERHNFWGS